MLVSSLRRGHNHGSSPKGKTPVKIFYKSTLLAMGGLVLASSLVHPSGTVKHQTASGPLLANTSATPEVTRIFEKSCQNCHSEQTKWPWYSYVAPLSWLIEKDVAGGRSHMNLSHWDAYTSSRQVELLTKIAVEARNRRMPLPQYVRIHPDARLSDEEITQLYSWAHTERSRVRALVTSSPNPPTN
jgi:Haem-binding domain